MKATLFAAALAQLAVAQPHRNAHQHLHNNKRDVVTQVEVVTALSPNIVYVNAAGEPVSTYFGGAPTAAATSVVKAPSAAPAPPKASSSSAAVVPVKQNVAAASSSPAAVASPQAKAASSGSSPLGIAYSPYTAAGGCKSASQVAADLAPLDFDLIRIYGTDCEQVQNVKAALQGKNTKLMVGMFELGSVSDEVSTIIDSMADNWDMIDTISVGNELVNSGQASVGEVVAAVTLARTLLTAAGYKGNIVTVDTFNAIIANPELCQVSDFAAANAYCFFDPTCSADQAGSWAVKTAQQVKDACGGKKTIITESGWPAAGTANGAAVPSPQNHDTAIAALKESFADGGLIIYGAYNDLWKTKSASTFYAEQSYGLFGNSAS